MAQDRGAAADGGGVDSVSVTIGPAPAASARVWLEAAQRTMATVRAHPELEVPVDVVDAFEGYLAQWGAAMGGDEFCWTGDVAVEVLRHLAAHWVRLVSLAREGGPGSFGLEPAAPEGAEFFDALAAGMAEALARADDRERFAPKFDEVVPAFAATASPGSAVGAPRRVLLVDDNPDIRMLVRIGLEASGGFEVVGEARDGQEAVDFVSRSCPDVVLLDLAMPVMDGFEALPLLVGGCPHVRVIVFSASDSPATRERIATSGSHGFLRKDAAIADVVAALRAA
jgi:CheY-like chemotaxis protein